MPEEDFSAVHSPGLSMSCEISHSFPTKLRLDWTVARRVFIRRHGKSKQILRSVVLKYQRPW